MPRPLYSMALALAVVVHHPAFAGDIPLLPKALVGQYGFDWHHPNNAKCQDRRTVNQTIPPLQTGDKWFIHCSHRLCGLSDQKRRISRVRDENSVPRRTRNDAGQRAVSPSFKIVTATEQLHLHGPIIHRLDSLPFAVFRRNAHQLRGRRARPHR